MTKSSASGSDAQARLEKIIESARELGVEMDEEEAIQWLTAVAAEQAHDKDVGVDAKSGVFGHRVALLDFDPTDLERVRRVASIVEIEDRPNVETAIALSGSSAQSHVQTFPGDFDYLERVNIKAASREEACTILGDVIRQKALAAAHGPGYQLIEVRFGTFNEKVSRGGKTLDVGAPISWSPAEVEDGHFEVLTPEGEVRRIDWKYACLDPGWCKLDWVLVDPGEPRAVKASNMLDATWEAPNGQLEPLDGFIDPYYQEVYLEAESIPVFSKIVSHLDPQALQKYVSDLEHEVKEYIGKGHANYGKAAKRMYNLFRLTGRYEAAAFVRELFDEPAALLYQIGALLDGLTDVGGDDSTIDRETLIQQIDTHIRDISTVAEGKLETELIMALIHLRDDVTGRTNLGDAWQDILREMQGKIDQLVNDFFRERLVAVPEIRDYLDSLERSGGH